MLPRIKLLSPPLKHPKAPVPPKKTRRGGSYNVQGSREAAGTLKSVREAQVYFTSPEWIRPRGKSGCFSGIKAECHAAGLAPKNIYVVFYQRCLIPGSEPRSWPPHYPPAPSLPLAAARNYSPDCPGLCLEHLCVSLPWKYHVAASVLGLEDEMFCKLVSSSAAHRGCFPLTLPTHSVLL